jgi:hypothetical protein
LKFRTRRSLGEKKVREMVKIERGPDEEIVVRLGLPRILPATTREHLRAARKEGLLSLRSLIDAVIERAEPAKKRKLKSRWNSKERSMKTCKEFDYLKTQAQIARSQLEQIESRMRELEKE